MRTFPMGSSTRLQYSTASQTVTESYENTINHVPTRSQGGADGRDGALWRDFTVQKFEFQRKVSTKEIIIC